MDRMTSLAVFVAAVDDGSLASAARRFGLSPAMAGKHVAALESTLKVRLLQRTTRRLSLTDAGLAYYRHAQRILEAFDEANREAGELHAAPRGTLRVSAPVTFGALHLGAAVAGYLARYPEVNVQVILSDRYIDLLAERIDVAIRIGRLADSSLVARRLAPCRMLACAAPAYLAHHGTPATPDALGECPRLVFSEAVSPGDWTFIDSEGRAQVVDGAPRLAANDAQILLAAALAGAGVTYGPSFVLGRHVAGGALVRLLPGYRTNDLGIHAVYPIRQISHKARLLVDELALAFGEDPPWDAWQQG